MYLTDDLNPVLDLNMTVVNPQMTYIRRVAALPDGGAFIINIVRSNDTDQVLRVNVRGQVIQHVYQCVRCGLRGLLVLNNNLYFIYGNGTLEQFDIDNNNTVQVYQVPDVYFMVHWGSLSYHPSVITHPDLMLLADILKGEIFSYNVTSENKQVHLTGLSFPTCVSFMTYNSHLYYVVCEWGHDQVRVYNSTWDWYQTLGGPAYSAIGLPDGSIIITDHNNHRVSLFNITGRLIRHILTRSDGLNRPWAMSISLPYLYLTDQQESYSNLTYTSYPEYKYLYRYKID